MVQSVLHTLTQPSRMHNSAYHDREFVAFLILSSLPLMGQEDYTIRWNLTVTHVIFKYFFARSDITVANGAYVTTHFFNKNYSYNNIPEFGTPFSEHSVYR